MRVRAGAGARVRVRAGAGARVRVRAGVGSRGSQGRLASRSEPWQAILHPLTTPPYYTPLLHPLASRSEPWQPRDVRGAPQHGGVTAEDEQRLLHLVRVRVRVRARVRARARARARVRARASPRVRARVRAARPLPSRRR